MHARQPPRRATVPPPPYLILSSGVMRRARGGERGPVRGGVRGCTDCAYVGGAARGTPADWPAGLASNNNPSLRCAWTMSPIFGGTREIHDEE